MWTGKVTMDDLVEIINQMEFMKHSPVKNDVSLSISVGNDVEAKIFVQDGDVSVSFNSDSGYNDIDDDYDDDEDYENYMM